MENFSFRIAAFLLLVATTSAVSVPEHNHEHELPKWEVPAGMDIHKLGQRANLPALDKALEPFHLLEGDSGPEFYVTDSHQEEHLNSIRKQIDESMNKQLHGVVWSVLDDDESYIKRLMALGADPDVPDFKGRSMSHQCSIEGSLPCVQRLILCRANLTARSQAGYTPREEAVNSRFGKDADVEAAWANAEKNRYPSIAKMAHDQDWYALQNILRRRIVPEEEASQEFDGKTAAEWALEHGRTGLAEEIKYYLPVEENTCLKDSLDAKVCNLDAKVTDMEAALTDLASKIESLISSVESLKSTTPSS